MNKTVTYDTDLYKLVPCELTDDMRDGWDLSPNDEDIDVAMRNGYRGMLAAVPDQLPGVVEHSGEPIGEITCNFPQGWHMQALVSWNQIGQGTKLYTNPAPSQPSRQELQEAGEHPAPCARHCEATAFKIEIATLLHGIRQKDRRIAELEASQPSAEDIRECGCGWSGPTSETVMCGGIGPLCPECRETTEISTKTRQPSAESLVAAALEAAADACETSEVLIAIEDWISRETLTSATAKGLATIIRALDKQKIIDGAGK